MTKDREICEAAADRERWSNAGPEFRAHFDPAYQTLLLDVVDAARKLGWGDTGPTRRKLREALIALDADGAGEDGG